MTTTEHEERDDAAATELRPATLAELRAARTVTVPAPSGLVFTIRPLNLERHAFAGGLPTRLRRLAMEGMDGLAAVLGTTGTAEEAIAEARRLEAERADIEDDGPTPEAVAILQYMDGLVVQQMVEPKITRELLKEDVLLPEDYRWLVRIAYGDELYDGEGRKLWGMPPIERFAPFPDEHGCAPDCAACLRSRLLLSRLSRR